MSILALLVEWSAVYLLQGGTVVIITIWLNKLANSIGTRVFFPPAKAAGRLFIEQDLIQIAPDLVQPRPILQ
jgi:hypothetical protein